ncbi:hypothetical protein BJ878DRAFT_217211 [Calycina marina]|uniref:Uncharacterized protein n=1 Tax=Calycina marina TaxID=1763456 RepID=A0A9P8CHC7_9HELO|nr:hypothetical protein BJ878DRAFT_217211 [Calycina marina]
MMSLQFPIMRVSPRKRHALMGLWALLCISFPKWLAYLKLAVEIRMLMKGHTFGNSERRSSPLSWSLVNLLSDSHVVSSTCKNQTCLMRWNWNITTKDHSE